MGLAAAVDDAAADRQGQREADMTRNVMLSDDRHYLVAWGVDHACGLFVQVWDNTVDNDDGPLTDLDAQLDGLTTDRLLEIADIYGVGDIVRATLNGAY